MKSKWWLISLAICLAIVSLAPLASASPDGLERVAEDKGFASSAQDSPIKLFADYLFPGIENEALATIVAGIIGTIILFVIVYVIAWLLAFRAKRTAS